MVTSSCTRIQNNAGERECFANKLSESSSIEPDHDALVVVWTSRDG
jgi:hypothetical protein